MLAPLLYLFIKLEFYEGGLRYGNKEIDQRVV